MIALVQETLPGFAAGVETYMYTYILVFMAEVVCFPQYKYKKKNTQIFYPRMANIELLSQSKQ